MAVHLVYDNLKKFEPIFVSWQIASCKEIGFENGRNSNFQGLVTLTLDPAIRHTVVHHSSTSTYIPNFIEIGRKFFSKVTTEVLVKYRVT